MNSTMQCLSQTKKLTAYFLDPQNKERIIKNNIAMKNPDDLQLSPKYLELITKLWATDGSKNYSPYNFMNCVQDMNPLFQKGQAGDAKDFIIYLLEQMHSELKKNMKKNEIKLPPLNQYDQKNAIQHFFQDFQEELSIFSDVFFGFNETTNVCLNCKNNYGSKGQAFPICYNYGIFNCIIFPLEEVKNMKNKFMQMMQNNMGFNNNFNFNMNNRVNLYECFIYNEKTDKFTGENQNYCNICRKMADSDYTSRIYISPNVLILILNRGKGNMYNVKCDFALNIDITNFVILKDRPQVTYNLYGVITHIGESGPNAHFVASCKSPVNGLWYRFNDGLVYQINDFQKEVHDFWNPYILFYQKDE
jgi:ubiquitin C-terminal hydrolase